MVASGSWAPTSGCDNQKERKGGKGGESNREYSSKVLASKELHYICIGINEMDSMALGLLSCRESRKDLWPRLITLLLLYFMLLYYLLFAARWWFPEDASLR